MCISKMEYLKKSKILLRVRPSSYGKIVHTVIGERR